MDVTVVLVVVSVGSVSGCDSDGGVVSSGSSRNNGGTRTCDSGCDRNQ